MSVEIYKCPSCGANLTFDPSSANVKCDYCQSSFTPEEIMAYHRHVQPEPHTSDTSGTSDADFQAHTHGYHCDNCGAEVVTEASTSSSFCYYCHSPVILSDRLAGEFAPDYILPFTIGKDDAKQRFLEWAKTFTLIPKGFASPEHLDKITGIYVPYWLADGVADVDVSGTGETSETHSDGRNNITTVNTFRFERKGRIDIDHVKTLASDKVEQDLINSVESNTKGKLKDFTTAYLSGYFSQRYTLSREDVEPITRQKLNRYVDNLIAREIGQYGSVNYQSNRRDISIKQWYYALLPMWILTYQFRGKTYVYALNGETGEFFGELPMDYSRLIKRMAIGFVGLAAALIAGGLFIW